MALSIPPLNDLVMSPCTGLHFKARITTVHLSETGKRSKMV